MADRIVIMKDGYIQQVGTPDEVYHQPANTFVARFIGAPSMNMLAASALGGTITLEAGQEIPGGRGDGPVTVGIRPDDLGLSDGVPLIGGRVTVREPLGHETLIYVDTGTAGEVIAKADGRTPPEVGAEVMLHVDPANLHLFDATSGEALE